MRRIGRVRRAARWITRCARRRICRSRPTSGGCLTPRVCLVRGGRITRATRENEEDRHEDDAKRPPIHTNISQINRMNLSVRQSASPATGGRMKPSLDFESTAHAVLRSYSAISADPHVGHGSSTPSTVVPHWRHSSTDWLLDGFRRWVTVLSMGRDERACDAL